MRILHLLTSNSLSGAESVAINIINKISSTESVYMSPEGAISETLKSENIRFIGMHKFSFINVIKKIRKHNPSIIHAHDLRASVYSVIPSLMSRSRVISHIHYNSPKMSKVSLTSLFYLFFSLFFEKVIVVSNQVKSEFVFSKILNKKIVVIPNVVDAKRILLLSQLETNEQYDLGFVGRITPVKDPFKFIEIVRNVKNKIPNIKAIMVGEGDVFNECSELIKKHNLVTNVHLVGFKNNPYKYMSSTKIMVSTSRFEGFGLAVVEAMILGKPVVVCNVGGLKELVKDNLNGFKCSTDEEFVDRIYELLSNDSLLNEMSNYAKIESRKYTEMDRYFETVSKIYGGILK
ncbi:glycosyltransferase [Paenibacillus agaridevorans]|uniref:glycosyltransferase n=1 Tax=Paenibacillus agaridevorans TaxID=171404 RepID=UPI001BE43B0B|nr:glycosyltransferase [Paenibacillus agaridevorans]